jgi:hypothetical protein
LKTRGGHRTGAGDCITRANRLVKCFAASSLVRVLTKVVQGQNLRKSGKIVKRYIVDFVERCGV